MNSSEPSLRMAPGDASMLVVVTSTSDSFLEKPRKKDMAMPRDRKIEDGLLR